MEIYVQQLPHKATDLDLIEAVADPLRAAATNPRAPQANFDAYTWPLKTPNGKTYTNGTIIVADKDVGERFLRQHSVSTSIRVRGTQPRFSQSRKKPPPELVSKLRTSRFVSPVEQRERERELQQLATPISVSALQFGRLCADNVFSPELEHSTERGNVVFAGKSRSITITLDIGGGRIEFSIPFNTISKALVLRHSDPSVLLLLSRPPVLAKVLLDTTEELLAMFAQLFRPISRKAATRERLGGLSPRDQARRPFVSTTARIVFPTKTELEKFRLRRLEAHLPHAVPATIRVERRDLYAEAHLHAVRSTMARLDIRVAFQINLMLHNGILDALQISQLAPDFVELQRSRGSLVAERVLAAFGAHQLRSRHGERGDWEEEIYDADQDESAYARPFGALVRQAGHQQPAEVAELRTQLVEATKYAHEQNSRRFTTDQSSVCRHVIVGPTGRRLDGPFPDQSNSILRRYDHPEFFIRVSIRDEDFDKIHFDRESDVAAFLRARFLPIFTDAGLDVAGRKFDFLGYSNSALRDHSAWFVAPHKQNDGALVTAASIRQALGNFSRVATIPARWMARIAQAFTATRPTITLKSHEVIRIPDIEITRNGKTSVFTDGVGTISPELAAEVDQALARDLTKFQRGQRVKPTAYQVRLGGAKGVLAVDPSLEGRYVQGFQPAEHKKIWPYIENNSIVCVRPSMEKFDTPNLTLDIADAFTRPLPAFLNRPLIKILEDLGVPSSVFLQLQRQAVVSVQAAKSSWRDAAALFERIGFGSSHLPHIFTRLTSIGANGLDEPFIRTCVELAVMHALRDLKYRARIPISDGWTLVGIADEDHFLDEGEIYACIKRKGSRTLYLKGEVCISRSPTIHPGDVRTNTVVFSTKGCRSLPSCLGGGDLDGDLYVLIPTQSLIPTSEVPPASYDPPTMVKLGRPCTINDGAQFFLQYILNDLMGVVATRHLHLADSSPDGVFSNDCMRLAKLHSDAVDFAKTGVSVRLTDLPKAPNLQARRPDFMCPEWRASKVNDEYYESTKALGRLFRDIPLQDLAPPLPTSNAASLDERHFITSALADLPIDGMAGGYLGSPSAELITEMLDDVEWFCDDFLRLSRLHTLSRRHDRHLSEEETFVGTIVAVSRDRRLRHDVISKLQEHTAAHFSATRDDILGPEGDEAERTQRAWAAWHAAKSSDQARFGVKSFGYIALDVLLSQVAAMNGEA